MWNFWDTLIIELISVFTFNSILILFRFIHLIWFSLFCMRFILNITFWVFINWICLLFIFILIILLFNFPIYLRTILTRFFIFLFIFFFVFQFWVFFIVFFVSSLMFCFGLIFWFLILCIFCIFWCFSRKIIIICAI